MSNTEMDQASSNHVPHNDDQNEEKQVFILPRMLQYFPLDH